MGTDIHMFVEAKDAKGNWQSMDSWDRELYEGDETPYTYVTTGVYGGRNYTVFGFLADVRNGSGFAGCDIGDPVRPFEVRGFPPDASAEVVDHWNNWGEHTPNYLTLGELLRYPWDTTVVKHRGVITGDEKKRYEWMVENGRKKHFIPHEWCGATNEPDQATVEWETPATETCAEFLSATLTKLSRIMFERGLGFEDVRIVFWFDS